MLLGLAVYNERRRGRVSEERRSERGAAVVEWLGISALSIGLLVVIFQGWKHLASNWWPASDPNSVCKTRRWR